MIDEFGEKRRLNVVLIFSSFNKRSYFSSFVESKNDTKISRSLLDESLLLVDSFADFSIFGEFNFVSEQITLESLSFTKTN